MAWLEYRLLGIHDCGNRDCYCRVLLRWLYKHLTERRAFILQKNLIIRLYPFAMKQKGAVFYIY